MLSKFGSFIASHGGFLKLIVFVSVVVFAETIFYYAVVPLLPHYAHRFDLSKSGAGNLVAAYPIGTLLGAIPGGLIREAHQHRAPR